MSIRATAGFSFLFVGVILNTHCAKQAPPANQETATADAPADAQRKGAVRSCKQSPGTKIVIGDDHTSVTPDPYYICKAENKGGGKRPKMFWHQPSKKGGKKGDKWKVEFTHGSPCADGRTLFEDFVGAAENPNNHCYVTAACASGGFCRVKYSVNGKDPEIVIEEGTESPSQSEIQKYRDSRKGKP